MKVTLTERDKLVIAIFENSEKPISESFVIASKIYKASKYIKNFKWKIDTSPWHKKYSRNYEKTIDLLLNKVVRKSSFRIEDNGDLVIFFPDGRSNCESGWLVKHDV